MGDTVARMILVARNANPLMAQFNAAVPFPGTPVPASATEQGVRK